MQIPNCILGSQNLNKSRDYWQIFKSFTELTSVHLSAKIRDRSAHTVRERKYPRPINQNHLRKLNHKITESESIENWDKSKRDPKYAGLLCERFRR